MVDESRRDWIDHTRRVIVKIGSRVLVDEEHRLEEDRVSALVDQMAGLRADGREVICVSSGALAAGEVFDVAIDINPASDTFRQWVGVTLTSENHLQIYVPPGYAHGFVVVSDSADFQYKCTEFYDPQDEAGIIWNDEEIAIDWPTDEKPLVSDKDANLPTIAQYTNSL